MVKKILQGVGVSVLFVLNAAGAWIAYSRFAIDHNMPLPPPFDAEQGTLVTSAGAVVTYADTTGTGRPIVLVHSINAAAGAYEMRPLFEHYAGQRPVYALDLPGFGLSERPDIVYSPTLYADVLNQFLREVVGEPADVVALSLSSEVAARAALDAPDGFNSLVMLAPTGFSDISEIDDGVYNTLSFPLWGQALFDLLVTKPSLNFFLGQIFSGDAPEEYIHYAYLTGHQPGGHFAPLYFVGGQLLTPAAHTELYAPLDLSVLAIYGDDPNVGFDNLPAFLDSNPNFTARRFNNTRALPHWDEFDRTITEMTEFWEAE
jgi:pimeloyl-ACP methyl ester carboxylesterase